jgi:hypothetical protein
MSEHYYLPAAQRSVRSTSKGIEIPRSLGDNVHHNLGIAMSKPEMIFENRSKNEVRPKTSILSWTWTMDFVNEIIIFVSIIISIS